MLDKNLIYIVDFDDSFTFNIASELYKYEKKICILSHNDFFKSDFFNTIILSEKKISVILGPGPGSPDNYKLYFKKISYLKKNLNIYVMGICLGHQILGLIDGFLISKSLYPKHGEQEIINFNDKNILVQRYNSLAVYNADNPIDEILIRKWERGISYQFHPESIGTHHKNLFFKELLHFIST